MALRFMDGFDHYASADLAKKWNSSSYSSFLTINSAAGRRGTSGLRANASGTVQYAGITLDSQTTWIVGMALLAATIPSNALFLSFWDGANFQCEMRLNTTGTFTFLRSPTVLGTTTNVISQNTFYYIEVRVLISTTVGTVDIRVNGTSWLALTGQNTQAGSANTANTIRIGNIAANGSMGQTDFDDFYLCDGTGSAPYNTFLGDCRIDTLFPNAEGGTQQWTPSTGTSHYTLVDETAPNTTDYVSSITPTQRELFGMQNLTTITGTIYGAQACLATMKSDAGSRVIRNVIRSGSSDSLGANVTLGTSQLYQISLHTTDPATSTAWTETGVNNAQVGAEVV